MQMREGAERERWDRNAIMTSSFVNTQTKTADDWKQFHKYEIVEESKTRVTKSTIKNFKQFFDKEPSNASS